MLRLLFLLLLALPAAEADYFDGSFAAFCNGDLLDSSEDVMNSHRHKKDRCEQTFVLPKGTSKERAVEDCHARFPFPLNSDATKKSYTGTKITCIWESSAQCEDNDSALLGRVCYRIGRECKGNWKPAKLRSSSNIPWLARLYNNHPVVRIASPPKQWTVPGAVYHRGYIHRNESSFAVKEKNDLILVLQRFPASAIYPGQLVSLHDTEQIPWLCSSRPIGHSADSDVPKTYPYLEADDFVIFSPRTLFQPPIFRGKEVLDLEAYHDFCGKYCDGCYAANEYHLKTQFKNGALPNGRYYVPIGYKNGSHKGEKKCDTKPEFMKKYVNEFKQLRHPKTKEVTGTQESDWLKGYPSNECVDQGRQAVQFYKRGSEQGLITALTFDRLPIYCVRGARPPPAKGTSCYKNSIQTSDGCKCKNGFTDALESNASVAAYAKQFNVPPGYVCLGPMKCSDKNNEIPIAYDTILLLIDGSWSVKDQFGEMVKWLRAMKSWLPRLPMRICQYANNCEEEKRFTLDKDWTDAEYEHAMDISVGKHLRQNTYTHTSIIQILHYWFDNIGLVKERALLVLVTDGESQDSQTIKEAARLYMRQLGVKLKLVLIVDPKNLDSPRFQQEIKVEVDDVKNDIVSIDNYSQLETALKKTFVTVQICSHTTEQVDEAMRDS